MFLASWRRFMVGLASLFLGGLWAPSAMGALVTSTVSFNLDVSAGDLGAAANNQTSWSTTLTVDGVSVRVTLAPGTRGTGTARLSWDGVDDSIGVVSVAPANKTANADEIDEWEYLDVSFSDPNSPTNQAVNVRITGIVLVDLFAQEQRQYQDGWTTKTTTYTEFGGYTVNGTTTTVNANSSQTPNTLGLNQRGVSVTSNKIRFEVPKTSTNGQQALASGSTNQTTDKRQDNDFAFRGISFEVTVTKDVPVVVGGVPELGGRGAAAPLALVLGAVAIGTARTRRRR